MAVFTPTEIYTNPRTEEHMRAALFAAKTRHDTAIVIINDQIRTEATFTGAVTGGDVVYITALGAAVKAQANAAATSTAFGVAAQAVSAGATGSIISFGNVERSDWTAVAGTAALTPGATYYLSATTAGTITTTAPTTVGQYVVQIGVAASTTKLNVRIQPEILL